MEVSLVAFSYFDVAIFGDAINSVLREDLAHAENVPKLKATGVGVLLNNATR